MSDYTDLAIEIELLKAKNNRLREELAAAQRVYTADDIWAAERRGFENGIRRAANICYELGERAMRQTQTITSRCEKAILAEIGEQP